MSSNNNSQNNRRNQQAFSNEIGDDQNDIIDFDTGNEFSSTLNRDIINA